MSGSRVVSLGSFFAGDNDGCDDANNTCKQIAVNGPISIKVLNFISEFSSLQPIDKMEISVPSETVDNISDYNFGKPYPARHETEINQHRNDPVQ